MENLTGIVISVAVTVIVLVAVFSFVPRIVQNFDCPAITGDTDLDFVEDAGENWTDSASLQAWKQSCVDVNEQSTVIPILLAVIVVLALLVVLVRMLQ